MFSASDIRAGFEDGREIIQLESQQVDADIVRGSLKNSLTVMGNLDGPEEQRELLTLLVKQVVYDGRNSKVQIDLKPLPKIWGDLDLLEGQFVYCKRWLPWSRRSQIQERRYLVFDRVFAGLGPG